ncbi:hypothetical protein [Dongia sedimenti]|uniref:Glycosaminoglycan attachment site n=1 Tax=Dongia sedimenti TaxID=3064282 RepID=A0ABU0YTM2_9PROT|nr:hypothetical protein [Rhodospirillaceae bacterium R-7]
MTAEDTGKSAEAADAAEQADILMPIPERRFDIYALTLPRGPNFDPREFVSSWRVRDGSAVGAVLEDLETGRYAILVLRRRVDHRFTVAADGGGFGSEDAALAALAQAMRPSQPPVALPPGERRRAPLLETDGRSTNAYFNILTGDISHLPALMTIGEIYLAMPRPDENFVPDFQTENFNARLWELHLLAAFREQDIAVSQPMRSPDFFLERMGHECWVEAVTANPRGERTHGYAPPVHVPADLAERLTGAPAERFAMTLRSKIQREYEKAPHVQGKAFALAIADYHAPSSMVWSREALPVYLYGVHPKVKDGPDGRVAIGDPLDRLQGEHGIPAGLFRDPAMKHLSAVMFSNAATFSKFNRMGFLAGWRPPGLSMVREGLIFDREPGALEPKQFRLDILSDEYTALWPDGEAWCQELEVFHNPLAEYPVAFDLIPGATHWFEEDGELSCSAYWKTSVLSSVTYLNLEK